MEVDLFRKSAKNFILLAVTAQSSRRFLRRTEKDPATEKDFFARDSRDIENKGLGKVIEMADSVIENDSSVEILHKRLDSFITRLNL
ncbi:MAG: hypothetical protein U9P44_00545 [archaeon]|nr:hypothetical protein [archaeon]